VKLYFFNAVVVNAAVLNAETTVLATSGVLISEPGR
jgi:hypothetical protein